MYSYSIYLVWRLNLHLAAGQMPLVNCFLKACQLQLLHWFMGAWQLQLVIWFMVACLPLAECLLKFSCEWVIYIDRIQDVTSRFTSGECQMSYVWRSSDIAEDGVWKMSDVLRLETIRPSWRTGELEKFRHKCQFFLEEWGQKGQQRWQVWWNFQNS